jgi:hypothetical protein
LIVYADTVLAFAVAAQGFKTISRQCGKITGRHSSFQPVQFHSRRPLKPGERLDPFSIGETSRPLVAVADNHRPYDNNKYALRQAYLSLNMQGVVLSPSKNTSSSE